MLILYLCKRRLPMVVATKRVCVTLMPFWNNYYWFKHAKTNISKVFCIYWWQIGSLKVQIVGYIACLKPSSKCGPWKIAKSCIKHFHNSAANTDNTLFGMNVFGVDNWLHIANSSMKSWKLKIAANFDCQSQLKMVNFTLVTIYKQLVLQ